MITEEYSRVIMMNPCGGHENITMLNDRSITPHNI